MDKKKGNKRQSGILIEYRGLGTVSMDELLQALITDIHVLRDDYNAKFTTGVRLFLPITNEYGEHIDIKKPSGERLSKFDTVHYRPTCLDFEM